MKSLQYIPSWAMGIYLDKLDPSLIRVIGMDMLNYDNNNQDCMRSQLVGEFLEQMR